MSKTSIKAIKQTEVALRALELRKAGATYEVIAQQLGYSSKSTAFNAVQRLMEKSRREGGQEAFEMELRRLDDLLMSVWPAARQGELSAIDRALRIMERRAKLMGLDAPEKTQQQIHQVIRVQYEDVQYVPTDFEPDVDIPVAALEDYSVDDDEPNPEEEFDNTIDDESTITTEGE